MSSAKDFKFFTVSHNGNLMQILLRNEFCLVFFLNYYSIAVNKPPRTRQA